VDKRILLSRIFLLVGWLCAAQACFAMQSPPRASAKKALAAKAVHARQHTTHAPANKPKRDFWDKCIACFCCDSCGEDEELEVQRLARQKALRKRRARPQPESHVFDDAGLVLAIM
jgi:hypothetical protein